MANLGNLALTAGNRVRALLEAAERMVLAMLARSIRASRPLNSRLRRQALRILQRGLIQARTEALRQYRQAYDAAARELETLAADIGRDAAALRDALPPKLPEPSVDASAILRHMRRDVDDLFRDVQEAAVAHREETGATVETAMQEALDAFAESGITSFTDAGGRRWGLQEYANMVVRTGVQRAGLQATVDRMLANGWDLCFVTPHMGCCPQCAAWQGVVMSLTGKSEGYPTVQQAMDGGLFHPNCAHVLQVYIPGVSDLSLGIPKGFTRDSNAKLYTARQRQRFIERKIRQAKREQAAAFTPEAEQAAREELRRWQAAARANARGEVQRRYDRERVMRGRSRLTLKRTVKDEDGSILFVHDETEAIQSANTFMDIASFFWYEDEFGHLRTVINDNYEGTDFEVLKEVAEGVQWARTHYNLTVKMPKTVQRGTLDTGVLGEYDRSTKEIFISEKIRLKDAFITAVHEMTHFADQMLGDVSGEIVEEALYSLDVDPYGDEANRLKLELASDSIETSDSPTELLAYSIDKYFCNTETTLSEAIVNLWFDRMGIR